MLILSENALVLGGSVVASSENFYYPASNIETLIAAEVWRSGATLTTETLTITLDRAYSSETIYLVLAGFDFSGISALTYTLGAFAPVAISGYTNGVAFATTIPVPAGATTTLVLTFTKNGASDIVQVGKIYAGNGFDNSPVDEPDKGSFTHVFYEGINKDYSIGGQKFSEARFQSWHADLSIPYVPEQIMSDTIRNFFLAVGTFQPFWIQIDPHGSTEAQPSEQLTQVRYVTLSAVPSENWIEFGDAGYLWSLSLSLEEQL
jgi:hypothetical protein